MPRPMPSPRGTNHEGLTLPGAVAAYDADPTDPTPMLKMFLAKLSDTDKDVLRSLLAADDDGGMPTNAMDGATRARASLYHDPDAGKSFEERFPGMKRFLP